MIQLIYNSSTTISAVDVEEMLKVARAKNAIMGITGILLFDGSQFVQLIEGLDDRIHSLYESIQSDNRHYDIMTLFVGAIDRRDFGKFSMLYRSISNLTTDLPMEDRLNMMLLRTKLLTLKG